MIPDFVKSAALAAVSLALCSSALAENQSASRVERSPMSAHDLVTMPRLGAPTVTPSGQYAAYSVTNTDPETFQRTRKHYLLGLENMGSVPVEIELPIAASSLAFGPDNFLYFISYENFDDVESDRGRIWRVALEADGNVTGPMLVAEFPDVDVEGFAIAPSGDRIAVWSHIDRNCERFGCEADEETLGSGRLYDGDAGLYRHWDRWVEPGKFNRVFVFGFANGEVVGDGVPLDGGAQEMAITGNSPTMPFGGGEDLAWAPDGSGVYFVLREAGSDEPFSTDLDIYWSDLSGGAPIVLTGANAAQDHSPAPSPDGRFLAYLAMERPGYEADKLVVHLRDLATGETRALTQSTDLSFGSLTWSADGSQLLATAAHVLDTPVFQIDPQSGEVTERNLIAGREAHIANLTPLPADRLLFTRDSIGVPHELYLANSGEKAHPLTDVVTSRMGALATTVTTRFSFAGAGGDTVWGQITKLEGQEGQIPAILYIHGGPQGTFRDGWSSRWNPRAVASQGYAVISVDFHGSAGYGQAFTDSINQDWGGKPLEDLKKGLAAALELDPQIDGSRACAMGASYGGYMVNWIAGHWPDRFNCLVQHDGLFDMRSFYYSTEELWFPRWDFGGSYEEARPTYERWNPANYVDQWRTPMLVIAGEEDFRVPYTQGLQSFTALQERGVPAQLLVFPDENHWVLNGENSLQWHNTVFAWLDRWLTDEPGAETAK